MTKANAIHNRIAVTEEDMPKTAYCRIDVRAVWDRKERERNGELSAADELALKMLYFSGSSSRGNRADV